MSGSKKKVLAGVAHPDDVEMVCAGTIRVLFECGWDFRYLSLTGGDYGSPSGQPADIRQRRIGEAEKAAVVLGGTFACAGIEDLKVHYCPEQLALVTEQIRRFSPDVVITLSPECYSLDHQETVRLVRAACFAAPVPLYSTGSPPMSARVPALYYADPLHGIDKYGRDVPADFWIDIGTTMERRLDALACHESQREWLRLHHGVDDFLQANRRLAELHGSRCGLGLAEGFRQHLGPGYNTDDLLGEALAKFIVRP